MATQPNPEFLEETMFANFGTRVLITDPAADKYLNASKEKKKKEERDEKWCGGPGGWDNFVERWHSDSD